MQKTENLSLSLMEPTDPVSAAPMNANFRALDAALTADKAELYAAIGSGGSTCRILTGSYVGDGTYGSDHPTRLSCPFYPLAFILMTSIDFCVTVLRPMQRHYRGTDVYNPVDLTWEENAVSWYSTKAASYQYNQADQVYDYVILGYEREKDPPA